MKSVKRWRDWKSFYGNKGEGTGRAVSLANNALVHPLEIAERVDYIWSEPSPENYFALLNQVKPELMMASLTAKGLDVDQEEPIYGTPFSYVEESGSFFEGLKHPEIKKEMTLPAANPFVPSEVKLLSERPIKVLDEPGAVLYYSQDQEFLRPKVAVQFKIRHPESFITLKNKVLKDLYVDAVSESLNELAYPARMAGLGYSISAGIEGLYLTFSGYNESAKTLIDQVIQAMLTVDISEERFEAIKDLSVRSLENFPKGDAWRQARSAKNELADKVFYTPEQRLEVLRGLKLNDVKSFVGKLYKEGYIEALIHGNVTKKEAVATVERVKGKLGMRALKKENVFENTSLVLADGELAKRTLALEVNNSVYWSEYVVGTDSTQTRAANLILNNYIAEPYYSEMRTTQQLGYIVWAFAGRGDDQQLLLLCDSVRSILGG